MIYRTSLKAGVSRKKGVSPAAGDVRGTMGGKNRAAGAYGGETFSQGNRKERTTGSGYTGGGTYLGGLPSDKLGTA